MKRILCLLTLCAVAWNAGAQNPDSAAIRKLYTEKSVLLRGNMYKYQLGDQVYPVKNLESLYRFHPEALTEFYKYQKNRRASVALLTVSGALVVSSLFVKDRDTKIILATGGIVTATISIPFVSGWSNHLLQSVWIYNRDVVTSQPY